MRKGHRGIRYSACVAALLVAGTTQALAMERLEFLTPDADASLRTALRGASLLVQARRDGTRDADEILASARADYGRILSALYAEGYFGGVISIRIDGREASAIQPLDAPDRITTVQVRIDTGPLYRFGLAEVAPLARGTVLPEEFAARQPASVTAIRDAAAAGVDGWRDQGHAKADVGGQRIVADHRSDTVDARVTIAPGPVVSFGDLRIEGQNRTREARIREIAGFPAGAVYSPQELADMTARLRRTGAFRSVTATEAETVNPDGSMDVTLSLTEAPLRRLGAGVEYTTTEALKLSAFWLHRNIFRGAERLRIDGEIAGIGGETGGMDYSLGARLTRPATFNEDTDLFVLGEVEQMNEPDYSSRAVTFGAGLSRELRDRVSGELSALYTYSSINDPSGTTIYQHLHFPLELTWERRNVPLDATDGFYLHGGIEPFVGLSGSEDAVKLTLDARGYEQFGGDRPLVVAARVQAGSIVGASITGLPPDERFYSGGGGTVRGQNYQSLDVDLGGGVTSGGRSFLGLSGEVRAGITDTIAGVVFADWGYISEGSVPGVDGESHAGAGVGIRYATSFGPIRLDVATPVTGNDAGSSIHLYIGIGQAF